VSPRIPTHAPPSFKLDGTLQIVSLVIIVLGLLLVVNGLTFLFTDRVRDLVGAILRLAAGAGLIAGALWLRLGRRNGALLTLLLLALIGVNALRVSLGAGLLVLLIAVGLAAPILGRWRRFS
jgi:hypothetical protein